MKKFLSDLFKERTGGKVSSKKFWGNILMGVCVGMLICDGFHFYEVSSTLFNTAVIAGTTLIGLRTVGNLLKPDAEQGK